MAKKNITSYKKKSDNKDLLNKFKEKKNEFDQEREDADGLLNGMSLFAMYVAVTGQHPFTGQPFHKDSRGNPVNTGIGTSKYPDARQFSVKLKKNEKELRENLAIIQGLFPEIDEDQQKKYEEYKEKRVELIKENSGIDDLSDLSDNEVMAVIRSEGNKAIYDDAVKKLEEEYKSVIKIQEEAEEERQEIMAEPLCKCDFEMVTEEDAQQTGLSVRQQKQIEPMLDY